MNQTEKFNASETAKHCFVSSVSCDHPYLKTDKRTRNKVCTSCGAVIYRIDRRMPVYLSIPQ